MKFHELPIDARFLIWHEQSKATYCKVNETQAIGLTNNRLFEPHPYTEVMPQHATDSKYYREQKV